MRVPPLGRVGRRAGATADADRSVGTPYSGATASAAIVVGARWVGGTDRETTVMSYTPQGEGWWQASDGWWYPPEEQPGYPMPPVGPPGTTGPYGYAAPFARPSPSNGSAIASLVLGLLSIVLCLGFLTGIPAIITGSSARKQIRASGGMQSGDGMAVAGLVLGWMGTVLGVIGVGFFAWVIWLGSNAEYDVDYSCDGYNCEPANGYCNEDRYYQDPDCGVGSSEGYGCTGINCEPSDGSCNSDRFFEDPDCG